MQFYMKCNWHCDIIVTRLIKKHVLQVDRVIPVAGKEQMTEFSHLFTEKTTKSLNDGHLWFSVVARPPQSRFTRVQRVSCCLCLLYLSMLTNAMFYEKDEGTNVYTFGPFALSPEQVKYSPLVCTFVFNKTYFSNIHVYHALVLFKQPICIDKFCNIFRPRYTGSLSGINGYSINMNFMLLIKTLLEWCVFLLLQKIVSWFGFIDIAV